MPARWGKRRYSDVRGCCGWSRSWSGCEPVRVARRAGRGRRGKTLCGWAEAVAEALAYAPSRVAAVLSEAAAGSPWQATLGLNEPSDPLRKAIQLMDDVVSNTAATSDHLDAILAAVSDDSASADDALTGLVRRVLLAALELREGRRRHEEDHRAT
jgi:hypothetical protein